MVSATAPTTAVNRRGRKRLITLLLLFIEPAPAKVVRTVDPGDALTCDGQGQLSVKLSPPPAKENTDNVTQRNRDTGQFGLNLSTSPAAPTGSRHHAW
jgi:hypothetical protein